MRLVGTSHLDLRAGQAPLLLCVAAILDADEFEPTCPAGLAWCCGSSSRGSGHSVGSCARHMSPRNAARCAPTTPLCSVAGWLLLLIPLRCSCSSVPLNLCFVGMVQEASALLVECLHTDPAARPTAGQLVARLSELVYPPTQPPPVSERWARLDGPCPLASALRIAWVWISKRLAPACASCQHSCCHVAPMHLRADPQAALHLHLVCTPAGLHSSKPACGSRCGPPVAGC